MNQEEQQKAMLKLMGYKPGVANVGPKHQAMHGYWSAAGFQTVEHVNATVDYLRDHVKVAEAEMALLWNDETLVERYEQRLREEYIKTVGYSGAAYWFMAGPAIRTRAILKTMKKWKI